MKLNRQSIIWVLVGVLFALGSIWSHYKIKVEMPRWGGPAAADQLGDLRVGSEAPDFSATDLRGRQVVLSEYQDRKVVVVDFWATWCGPCLMAMPALQEIHDEFEGVEILAVNLGEDPDRIRRFMERKDYTFRVVVDRDQATVKRFGVRFIPALVVVGADGRIELIQVGYSPHEADELRELLERLTGERQSVG